MSTPSNNNIPIPEEWPDAICENFDPVRVLGQGGFASVVLAKLKPHAKGERADRVRQGAAAEKASSSSGSSSSGSSSILVAIKVAGNAKRGVSKSERAYGHREIDILQAISHPNIMKCWDYVDPSSSGSSSNMALVLSYSKGPTVDALLKHGGALSNVFGRVVIAQIVDAVAYLHSHAVVHRDLKPDNFIVTVAVSSDASIWDNPEDYDDDDDDDGNHHENNNNNAPHRRQQPDWTALLQKWHVTLVDFGFARALTPQDVMEPSPEFIKENMDASFHNTKYQLDASLGNSLGASRRSLKHSLSSLSNSGGNNNKRGSVALGRRPSISRQMHRQMSALGSPQFAAPEIRRQIINVKPTTTTTTAGTTGTAQKEQDEQEEDVTNTISSFVSEYGLLVDAYSLGCSIRYMMTGVLPHKSVSEAIAEQSNIIELLCGLCSSSSSSSSSSNKKGGGARSKPRFRLVEDLPGEIQRLISKLTEREESQRTSVRAARRYHWINDVLPTPDEFHKEGTETIMDAKKIKYLNFVVVGHPHNHDPHP